MVRSLHSEHEQLQRSRIDPLDIFIDHQHRPLLLQMPELREKRVEGFLFPLLRVHLKQFALPISWY
jgi:hypothetical protein